MDAVSRDSRSRVRRALLSWFRRHQRDLPWRRDRDPYRIWVSEIMLQQTQVVTAIPYFERFLQAFPTLDRLAAASEQEVLCQWEGLGYYRRARNLHRAAKQIVAEHGGQFPTDHAVVRTLPGIGRYTAGAILSQAFEQRLPILEANSQRLLCRLFGVREDPRRGATRQWLWEAAESLLPARKIGEFNQALMELGALLCTAAQPKCSACPLASLCVARREGLTLVIPVRAEVRQPIEIQEVGVVVHRRQRVLLVQRPNTGRWAEMWEFPHGTLHPSEPHAAAAHRLLLELTGVQADLGPELLTLRHAVTHHRITLLCFAATYRDGQFRSAFYQHAQWLGPQQLADYPVSAPQRRLAEVVLASGSRQGRRATSPDLTQ